MSNGDPTNKFQTLERLSVVWSKAEHNPYTRHKLDLTNPIRGKTLRASVQSHVGRPETSKIKPALQILASHKVANLRVGTLGKVERKMKTKLNSHCFAPRMRTTESAVSWVLPQDG